MNNYFRGVAMIGQIFPTMRRRPAQTSAVSAWNGVGDAFAQAGDNIRDALKEFNEIKTRESLAR
jgi:hypothetical protein